MSGNRIGGIKCRDKNKAKNPNFYQEIGAIGGKKSRGGGFADVELARRAGAGGGRKSKRVVANG